LLELHHFYLIRRNKILGKRTLHLIPERRNI
jgi:hypothetical protein